MVYALDTNSVIHYLRNERNLHRNFKNAINTGAGVVIPKIVDYEIKRGFAIQFAPAKEKLYFGLTGVTGFCDIIEMDANIWVRAERVYAELHNKRFTVGELDILIAALCIENDYVLVTNNTKDFNKIDNLSIIDWTTPINEI